jgi:hypothetical protein
VAGEKVMTKLKVRHAILWEGKPAAVSDWEEIEAACPRDAIIDNCEKHGLRDLFYSTEYQRIMDSRNLFQYNETYILKVYIQLVDESGSDKTYWMHGGYYGEYNDGKIMEEISRGTRNEKRME